MNADPIAALREGAITVDQCVADLHEEHHRTMRRRQQRAERALALVEARQQGFITPVECGDELLLIAALCDGDRAATDANVAFLRQHVPVARFTA